MDMETSVLGIRVNSVSYLSVTRQISAWAVDRESRTICAATVHTVMEARDSTDFMEAINRADLVTPDGMPLVWMLRLKGQRTQGRVYGPTLMLLVLEMAAREDLPVGFYGGRPEVLDMLIKRMQARYPGLNVAYSYSPPFRDLSSDEDRDVVDAIRMSGIRVLFVGLGCPKQERWMAAQRGRIPAVMIGVGAAFDFHAGAKPQSPSWLQNIGLEWLFRLVTEPRRLWRRYLYHNPRFIILAIADLLGFLR
jgi:N-acetylglucosaminyldiphosphoundecaprenol N-acetyl-beta-D-mannosaminyltransferase